MKRGMIRLSTRCVLALATMLVADGARAQLALVTDCAKLSIRLVGIPEAAGMRCNGDEDQRDESIDASGPEREFVIRHQGTLPRYFLVREEATNLVAKLVESNVAAEPGEPFEVEDFDVVRYRAVASEAERPACFYFLNYAGHVAHTTGYRHAIIGYYCDNTGKEASDQRIGELLGAIEADFW